MELCRYSLEWRPLRASQRIEMYSSPMRTGRTGRACYQKGPHTHPTVIGLACSRLQLRRCPRRLAFVHLLLPVLRTSRAVMAKPVGSVFLGDVQRQRILSSSSPPSSPPPNLSPSVMSSFHDLDLDFQEEPKPAAHAPSIPPALSLDLRLRWLETLLFGARPESSERKDGAKGPLKEAETLTRRAEELQRKLQSIVEGNEGLRKFMEHCATVLPLQNVNSESQCTCRRPAFSFTHACLCVVWHPPYRPASLRDYVAERV